MMQTVLLFVMLAVLVGLLVLGIVAALTLNRELARFKANITAFVSAPDAATPSPLARTVDEMSQLVGRAVVGQAKATFMGEASAASRAAGKAQNEALLAKFPWLAAIASIAPGFSKSLIKNPAMLNLASGIVDKAKAAQPGQPAAGQSAGNGARPGVVFESKL